MASFFKRDVFSVGFGDQTVYDTAVAITDIMETTLFDVSFAREINDLPLARTADFEEPQRVVGSKHGGTISFQAPMTSQAEGFDPTAGVPVITNPLLKLIKDFFGSSHVDPDYNNTIVAGSDGNTWVVDSGETFLPGQAYATVGADPFVSHSAGFIKSVSTVTGQLFEDAGDNPTVDDTVDPMLTFYNGTTVAQPTPRTFAMYGDGAAQLCKFVGCMPQQLQISMTAGQVPMATFTYVFTDYEYATSGGGLQAVTNYQRLAPIMGDERGRVFINGTSTGTADPDGTCGLTDLQLTIDCELTPIPCHAGAQGYSDSIVRRRVATVTGSVPWTNDLTPAFVSGTDNIFNNALTNGTTISLSMQTGANSGKLMQFLIPAAIVKAQSSQVDQNGLQGFDFTLGVGSYDGDGASTNAGDSDIRLAFG